MWTLLSIRLLALGLLLGQLQSAAVQAQRYYMNFAFNNNQPDGSASDGGDDTDALSGDGIDALSDDGVDGSPGDTSEHESEIAALSMHGPAAWRDEEHSLQNDDDYEDENHDDEEYHVDDEDDDEDYAENEYQDDHENHTDLKGRADPENQADDGESLDPPDRGQDSLGDPHVPSIYESFESEPGSESEPDSSNSREKVARSKNDEEAPDSV